MPTDSLAKSPKIDQTYNDKGLSHQTSNIKGPQYLLQVKCVKRLLRTSLMPLKDFRLCEMKSLQRGFCVGNSYF